LRFAPLLVALLLLAAFAWRLASPRDESVASRMVGQPVPDFALPAAISGKPGLTSAELARGGPRLVNLFASWCAPCIAEAPVLLALKQSGVVIDGIAVRDRPADTAAFLARHGDPFERVGEDRDSRVQILLGASGVPETFVVDRAGVIRYQHVGPIGPEDLADLRARVEALR
jgi:cytochrome c biogenesis protein CcmG/thiol:disulfide interchange protein DsbE